MANPNYSRTLAGAPKRGVAISPEERRPISIPKGETITPIRTMPKPPAGSGENGNVSAAARASMKANPLPRPAGENGNISAAAMASLKARGITPSPALTGARPNVRAVERANANASFKRPATTAPGERGSARARRPGGTLPPPPTRTRRQQ